jgi:hypothetical protein
MTVHTRDIFVTSLLVLLPLTSSRVSAQEGGSFRVDVLDQARLSRPPFEVMRGGTLGLRITVYSESGPYSVVITELDAVSREPIGVPESFSSDDRSFTWSYEPPEFAVGSRIFRLTVVDAADASRTTDIGITVTCPSRRVCLVRDEDTGVLRLHPPNLAVAEILNRFDIDGDGLADNSPDRDGDGLPDSWEDGGVFYPAPSAIVPGTPPTPIFTRLAVTTSGDTADTDGDGLSDFTEVFGLLFIDENRDGRLSADEWNDTNGDGLPSVGEWPVDNSGQGTLLHDFDGFIFTDPTNPDTDGDGILDGEDPDPLINVRAFGNTDPIVIRFGVLDDADIDKDGLGNAMDMGNDLVSTDGPGVRDFQAIDNPQDVRRLLQLFRRDLLQENIIPESDIEDLLGADWDGNGLWRTTDVREWTPIIDLADPFASPPDEFFTVGDHRLYAEQKFATLAEVYNDSGSYDRYGSHGVGLGWQTLLRPAATTQFMPDKRIWAILYAWRMPGFDIDGDGFVGAPNLPATRTKPGPNGDVAVVGLRTDPASGRLLLSENGSLTEGTGWRPFDDRIAIVTDDLQERQNPRLDGRITIPGVPALPCGSAGGAGMMLTAVGLVGMRRLRFRR